MENQNDVKKKLGRPPLEDSEVQHTRHIRMNDALWAKAKRLGGERGAGDWIRAEIERSWAERGLEAPRRGRPLLNPGQPMKAHRITMTDQEWEKLNRICGFDGASAWVRRMIRAEPEA